DRLIGLRPTWRDLSVTIGVDDGWAPTCRLFGIMRLIPGVHVHPPHGVVAARVVDEVVVAELVVIDAEAGVHDLPLLRFRIVVGCLLAAATVGIVLAELIRIWSRAPRWLVGRFTIADGHPDAAL